MSKLSQVNWILCVAIAICWTSQVQAQLTFNSPPDISYDNGEMVIELTNNDDLLMIDSAGSSYVKVSNQHMSRYVRRTWFDRIRVRAFDGNDYVLMGNTLGQYPLIVHGGDGRDVIDCGSCASADVYGGYGNDWIGGTEGDDNLFGGSDNDTLFGKGGEDYLSGLFGSDYLNGGDEDDTLDAGAFQVENRILGGRGADRFNVLVNGRWVRIRNGHDFHWNQGDTVGNADIAPFIGG